jgi:hypothetical protein
VAPHYLSSRDFRLCAGFWTPAATARGTVRHAGVQKPAQEETFVKRHPTRTGHPRNHGGRGSEFAYVVTYVILRSPVVLWIGKRLGCTQLIEHSGWTIQCWREGRLANHPGNGG